MFRANRPEFIASESIKRPTKRRAIPSCFSKHRGSATRLRPSHLLRAEHVHDWRRRRGQRGHKVHSRASQIEARAKQLANDAITIAVLEVASSMEMIGAVTYSR